MSVHTEALAASETLGSAIKKGLCNLVEFFILKKDADVMEALDLAAETGNEEMKKAVKNAFLVIVAMLVKHLSYQKYEGVVSSQYGTGSNHIVVLAKNKDGKDVEAGTLWVKHENPRKWTLETRDEELGSVMEEVAGIFNCNLQTEK